MEILSTELLAIAEAFEAQRPEPHGHRRHRYHQPAGNHDYVDKTTGKPVPTPLSGSAAEPRPSVDRLTRMAQRIWC